MTVPTLLACAGLAMELADEVEGALSVGRAFHVDADEVVDGVMAAAFATSSRDQVIGQLLARRRDPCG